MGCDSPLKGWRNPDTGGIQFRRDNAREKMEVACGQCLGCRLDYSRMWAMRIAHEASLWEYSGGNCFVTLTYRDMKECTMHQLENFLHIPDDWSLNKQHMRDFIKRLRKLFPQRIRYFYAGEYGKKCKHGIDVEHVGCPLCNCGRPHYHVCLFNCTFPDLEPYLTDGGITRYTSPMLEECWKYGFVDVGELNYNSALYTAKYALKKVRGVKSDYHYMHCDLDGIVTWIEPEFVSMSRGNAHYKGQRCGIGAGWFEKYHEDVFPSDEVPIPGHGVMKGVPRYYNDIFADMNPEEMEKIKEMRRAYMALNKEEFQHDRLLAKHKCKKARLNDKEKFL